MKDKKRFVLIIFSLAVLFLIIYFSRGPTGYRRHGLISGGESVFDLKNKELVRAFVGINLSLKDDLERKARALEQESQRVINLEEKVKKLFIQNESLSLELKTAKLTSQELLDSTRPFKEKLKLIDNDLAANMFAPAQADKVKSQLRSVYKELGRIDSDIQKLIQQAKGYKILADDLEKRLNTSGRDLEAAKKELAEGKAKYSGLEKELSLRSTESEKTKSAKSELERSFNDLKKRNDSLSNEITRLEGDLKAAQASAARMREAKGQLADDKNQEIAKLQEDLKAAQAYAARMAQEKEQLLLEKNQVLKQSEEKQIGKDEAERKAGLLNNDILKLEEDLEAAQAAIAKLSEEKEQLIRNRDDGLARGRELERKNIALAGDISRLDEDSKILQASLDKLAREKDGITKQRDEGIIKNNELSGINQDLTSRILKLTDVNAKLAGDLSLVKSQIEEVKSKYSRVREDYAKASVYMRKKRTASARRADKILQYQDIEANLKAKAEDLRLSLEAQIKESAVLREQLVAVQLENQNLKDEVNQLDEKLKDLQERWQKVSDMLKKLGEGPEPAAAASSKNVSIIIEENKPAEEPVAQSRANEQ